MAVSDPDDDHLCQEMIVTTSPQEDPERRPSTEDWGGKSASDYVCPRCFKNFQTGEFWIECDACHEWFHGSCVFVREHESCEIEKFFCVTCEQDHGLSVMKPVTNDHRHDRTEENADRKPVQAGSPRFIKWIRCQKSFPDVPDHLIQKLTDGRDLTIDSLMQKGFRVPILIEESSGLDLKLPHSDLRIPEILNHFPEDHVLDVIDSRRQLTIKLTSDEFVRLATRATEHTSCYNCISLEVSKTELGKQIHPPQVVRDISWVDNDWPADESEKRPFVSKYCLMSMADSYTDFHIDFGGTSVWYHVLRGEKIFYLIEPSEENLILYEEWMHLKNQSEVFFGGEITGKSCYKLTLKQGNTLLIPTAWIHAVLTPSDSLVFGGNFLHSLNMGMQIRIHEMEKRMATPEKFQFPFFALAHWYSLNSTIKLLKEYCSEDQVPPHDLAHGAAALLFSLKQWAEQQNQPGNDSTTAAATNQVNNEVKSLVPVGFDCRRAIKKLSKVVKSLKKIRDRQKKSTATTTATMTTIPGTATDASSDSERELVMDEGAIETIRQKVKDEESRSKGMIKMRLSLCGKSGLPEVTQVATTDPPSDDHPIGKRKRNKRSSSIEEDPDIMEMIRDQPEDADFIYFDVAEDDEDEDIVTATSTPDYAWSPRAKVVINRSAPKDARPARENARREFVDACIANSAAKMENMTGSSRKRVTPGRRKSRGSSSNARKSLEERRPSSPSSANAAVVPASSAPSKDEKRKSSPTPRFARKGEKTAKQRLAKLMKISHR